MKLELPATAAPCSGKRRQFGKMVGKMMGGEAKPGLKDSEVENLQAVVVWPERLKGQRGHAQQAVAAELLPPHF
jgi:hypothetical protein